MGDPNQRINYKWPEQSFLIINGFLSLTVSVNILNLMAPDPENYSSFYQIHHN